MSGAGNPLGYDSGADHMIEPADPWLDDVLGDPAAAKLSELGDAALHRIHRRAQHAGDRNGSSVSGVSLTELAKAVAVALRHGDRPGAEQLVEAGAALFGSGPLIAAVGMASHELEFAELQGAR
jgi:hypothetical protein